MCDWSGITENDGFQFDGVYPADELPPDGETDPEDDEQDSDSGVYVLSVVPFSEDELEDDPWWFDDDPWWLEDEPV